MGEGVMGEGVMGEGVMGEGGGNGWKVQSYYENVCE